MAFYLAETFICTVLISHNSYIPCACVGINLFSRLESEKTAGHWTHCAVQQWISVDVTFAICSTIDLNSLKTRNLNY